MTAPVLDEARLRESLDDLERLGKDQNNHFAFATIFDAVNRSRELLDALSAERERGDRASSVMARAHNAIGSGKYDRATVRQWLTDGINALATQSPSRTGEG